MALALVATAALLVGIVVGAGSPAVRSPRAASFVPDGYFGALRALAGTGPRSLSAAERAAESRAIERTLAYTPYVRVAGAQHREVALTFDDGPGPYTSQIVRELATLNAPGTFFEVGAEERYFSAGTAAVVEHGFPVGDHTESHKPMSTLSVKLQREQLIEDADAIGDYGAPFPHMFRPPYGVWNATTLALLRQYRMLMVLWTVDTSDYLQPGVPTIVARALDGARPGAIILLHDAGGDRAQTVAA
ncbi:MAG: polysaccharide deacetylase family protein, partial [Solirubrobacteraceae bacterium]